MNRLTRKSEHNINGYVYLEKQNRIGKNPALVKLGKLEDLMEKYEIKSIDELEEIIKDYDDMAKTIVEMGLGVKVEIKQ